MVPDKFNMVDMGGIDIIAVQGQAVTGLYQRLVDSIALCRYQCLYNWKFDDIVIPPTNVECRVSGEYVLINDNVKVDENDVVHIYAPVIGANIVPVSLGINGTFYATGDVDGFNPVTVNVLPPLQQKTATENGTITPDSGYYGLSSVIVDVSGSGVSSLQFHLGQLKIDTGVITESNEYCYSDLVPINSGSGRWFLDLARSDLSSYYIGISFFAEDGTTQVGYIRQYESYRSYSASIPNTAKFFRIAAKVSDMSFASALFLPENIFIFNPTANSFKTNLT